MEKYIKEYYELWFGINDVYTSWAKSHGLTVNALFILYLIWEGGYTMQEIVNKLMISKQTVGSILNGFESDGIITRIENINDRRSKEIVFTDKGKKYAEKIVNALSDFETKAFNAMTDINRQELIRSNKILLSSLQKAFIKEKK